MMASLPLSSKDLVFGCGSYGGCFSRGKLSPKKNLLITRFFIKLINFQKEEERGLENFSSLSPRLFSWSDRSLDFSHIS